MKNLFVLVAAFSISICAHQVSAQTANKINTDSTKTLSQKQVPAQTSDINSSDTTTSSLSHQAPTPPVNNNYSDSATITFLKIEHDYGTIKKGEDGFCTFSFENTGNIPLMLFNVESTCGCTVPTWPKEPILPGDYGDINVEYDTYRTGVFHKSIRVISNAQTVVLRIKGNVIP